MKTLRTFVLFMLLFVFISPIVVRAVERENCRDFFFDEVDCTQLDTPITKGEFALLLVRFFKVDLRDAPIDFDKTPHQNISDAAYTLTQEDVIRGELESSTSLGLGNFLNRAVAVTMLGRLVPQLQKYPADGSLSDLLEYSWYQNYASRLVRSGTILGKLKDGVRLFAAEDLLTLREALYLSYQAGRAVQYYDISFVTNSELPKKDVIIQDDAIAIYDNTTYNDIFNERSSTEVESDELSDEIRIVTGDLVEQTIPSGANAVTVGYFTLSGDAIIREITLKRIGPGKETDFEGVALYFSDRDSTIPVRMTSSRAIRSDDQTVTFPLDVSLDDEGIFYLIATISQQAQSPSQHRFYIQQIVTDKRTFQFSDPQKAHHQSTISLARAETGMATMRNNASLNDLLRKPEDYITRWELELSGSEGADLSLISLHIQGTVSPQSLKNLRLYVSGRSEPISIVDRVRRNGLATFIICLPENTNFCEPLSLEKGSVSVFSVLADLRDVRHLQTIEVSLDDPTDINLIGHNLGYGLQIDSREFRTTARAF